MKNAKLARELSENHFQVVFPRIRELEKLIDEFINIGVTQLMFDFGQPVPFEIIEEFTKHGYDA